MNLYIMTRGRVGKQYTLGRLPERWRERTWLVVPEIESIDYYTEHYRECSILPVPPTVTNYSQKFQWILNNGMKDSYDKAVILDDDLVFSRKILKKCDECEDGRWYDASHGCTRTCRTCEGIGEVGESLKTITDPEELNPLFDQMEALLDEYPLVGVHPRQMGQNATPPFVENGRIICMQGINRRLIGHVKVDQFPILADVVLNCTVLARGQRNAIITNYFQDHGPCQAPGGCSLYRTAAMQTEAVQYLANRFGPYVKVVERRTKTDWLQNEQGVRYDYTAQWKRLQAAGRAHVLDPGKVPNPDREGAGATKAVEC